MKRNKEKIELNLIFQGNLINFLIKHKLYEKFKNKEIKCINCNNTVTEENLGLIKVKKNEIVFICDNIECIQKANDGNP